MLKYIPDLLTEKLPLNEESLSFMIENIDKNEIKKELCNEIDTLLSIRDKYREISTSHLAFLRIGRIAFAATKRVLHLLLCIVPPLFTIIGGFYYCLGGLFTHNSDDPLERANFISLDHTKSINPLHTLYYLSGKYNFYMVPCGNLWYTEECPMNNVTQILNLHKMLHISVSLSNDEESFLSHFQSGNRTLCVLPKNLSITDNYSVPLEASYAPLPFLDLYLWQMIICVIISTSLLEAFLDLHQRYRAILRYINQCRIDFSLSFLKRYIYCRDMDKDYLSLALRSLTAHAGNTMFVEISTKEVAKRFVQCGNDIQLNNASKAQLQELISSEKMKLSKLLLLCSLLGKEDECSSISKLVRAALLILLDATWFSLLRCQPYGMITVLLLRLLFLTTFPMEDFSDDSLINTTVRFSDISSAYPIIDRLPEPTQRALIERLAIEYIYYEASPLKKASTMERVIMVIYRLYDGNEMRSLLSILDK